MTYRIPAQVDGAGSIAGPGSLLISSTDLVSDASQVNVQHGTSYTLQSSDNLVPIYFTNDSAITLTVPIGLGSGFSCGIVQGGDGQITPTADGTAIENRLSYTQTAGQYAYAVLLAVAADFFILAGDCA